MDPEILLPWQRETTSHLCISIEVSFSREKVTVKTRIEWSVATNQDGHVFLSAKKKIEKRGEEEGDEFETYVRSTL